VGGKQKEVKEIQVPETPGIVPADAHQTRQRKKDRTIVEQVGKRAEKEKEKETPKKNPYAPSPCVLSHPQKPHAIYVTSAMQKNNHISDDAHFMSVWGV